MHDNLRNDDIDKVLYPWTTSVAITREQRHEADQGGRPGDPSPAPIMESAPAVAAVSVGGSGSGYPDSVDSSPRSRGGDSWDEPFTSSAAASSRLRVMCSYGGRIVPRPTDNSLCYLGGETRMVTVDRHSSLADLSAKLSRDLLGGRPFSLKYQLPNEDLDSLISVTTDEDLENMIEELDRISAATAAPASSTGGGSARSPRLRLFLFPSISDSAPSSAIGSLLDDSKSETWFVDALNSAIGGMGVDALSTDSASVNCLLGLEDDSSVHSRRGGGGGGHSDAEQLVLPRPDSSGKLVRHGQDVHSVPGSPMLDKVSSFGSTSSAPSLSNLPPIPVPADGRAAAEQRISGIDDHFAHMGLSPDSATWPDEGFKETRYPPHHQPPPPIPLPTAVAPSSTTSPTENLNRDFSDDDKSDHGGALRPSQPTKPTQIDAPTPDPMSRYHLSCVSTSPTSKNGEFCQNFLLLISSSRPTYLNPSSDAIYRGPSPVTDAPGHVMASPQLEQLQQQQSHPHLNQRQQPQLTSANPHYIHHHHPAAGTVVPMPSYYSIAAHSMQKSPQTYQFDPQIPMYYMPVRHTSPFTLGTTVQPNLLDPSYISSTAAPAVPAPGIVTKPDLPGSYYKTAATTPAAAALQPQLIHVAANQTHPYAGPGYNVIQHPHLSQSQSPATMTNLGYEAAAVPVHPQMYYSQASSRPVHPQYQGVSSTTVIPDAAALGDSNTSRTS
ncbi:hypothetical protein GW17_00051422 [Ensete ventricosum]|nr:hypothetical protein GW17_00051422 [Ensete ventricosum]